MMEMKVLAGSSELQVAAAGCASSSSSFRSTVICVNWLCLACCLPGATHPRRPTAVRTCYRNQTIAQPRQIARQVCLEIGPQSKYTISARCTSHKFKTTSTLKTTSVYFYDCNQNDAKILLSGR